jgi:hypothetical protein
VALNDSQNDDGWKSLHCSHVSVVVTVDETDSTASWCPLVAANKQMYASMKCLYWLDIDGGVLLTPLFSFLRHVFIDLNSFTF